MMRVTLVTAAALIVATNTMVHADPVADSYTSEGFLLRLGDGTELVDSDFEWDGDIGRADSLTVKIIRTTGPGCARKQIAARVTGDEPVLLKDVVVERLRTDEETDLGGLGQPVFIGQNVWAGLEYPAGENKHADGLVTLEHHPGVWLRPGDDWWLSKTAAIGTSETKPVEAAFRDYLSAIRREPRPYVVYNSWYDARRGEMTNDLLIERARHIRDELAVKRAAPFDGVAIDDGWQDPKSIWEIDRTHFPDGFGPLYESLSDLGVSLDLWHPLTAIRGNLSTAWGRENGYEVSPDDRFFCLSGPKHNAALREVMARHVREYDIDYFKHDFNTFACSADGHGHLPDGTYGRDANVDAELAMFAFLDEVNPGIYINPSSGMWLSPWWLMHVDTVWMRYCADFGWDKTVPAFEARDQAMTYRDSNLWRNLHGDRVQFPVSAIMTIGIIDGKLLRLGGEGEPLDRWANNVVVNMGRGSMLQELYITPDLLSDGQWDVLAAALKWQRRFLKQTASGRMLPADPRWGDVYGWVHANEDGGFVCLRNPGIVARTVEVALPELAQGLPYAATRVYPWRERLPLAGAALRTEVEPFGVTVIELTTGGGARQLPIAGPRASLVAQEPNRAVYDIWGHPGHEVNATTSIEKVYGVDLEGSTQTGSWSPGHGSLSVRFPGEPYHLWQIGTDADERGFNITVDDGVAWKWVLEARGLPDGEAPRMLVDGGPIEPSRVEGNGWIAFTHDLPTGEHHASWQPHDAEAGPSPFSSPAYTLQTYFVRAAQLVPIRMHLKHSAKPEPRDELPTPYANIERSTWIGPLVIVESDGSPLTVGIAQQELENATAAKLHVSAFGSQGGEYADKWIVLNGERIGRLPANSSTQRPDAWEEFEIDLTLDQMGLVRMRNEVAIELEANDMLKLTDLALAVKKADGPWAETDHDATVWCSSPAWLYTEGQTFAGRTPGVVLSFREP
ncbi:MAG TPA: hypothetical protein QGH10_05120 [Armatimonadota bacterium]|nr:hypothetical protein [Armatimonadota bacterium]